MIRVQLDEIREETVYHNRRIKKRMMIRPGEIPQVTYFSQAVFPPGEIADVHAHDHMVEVFFVVSGSGLIKVDGKEYRLDKGTCIAVAPGESHEIANTGKDALVFTYFGIKQQ